MKPEHYPNHEPEAPAYPVLPFLVAAKAGEELLLRQPGGKAYRATVIAAQQFAVVIAAWIAPTTPTPRAFAMNGYELGVREAATLHPMPEDRADRLRRRELFFIFSELLASEGEDILPTDVLNAAIVEARRYRRDRARAKDRQLRGIHSAYLKERSRTRT